MLAMAQQMDIANLGNEQQMELANLAERAATDSANMTEENRFRFKELNNCYKSLISRCTVTTASRSCKSFYGRKDFIS
jgi:hypothetical protein